MALALGMPIFLWFRYSRDRIEQANPEDVILVERTGTHLVPFPPLLLIHLTEAPFRLLPHTALVPLPLFPCPPPPLQPSLGRSDKPILLFDTLAALKTPSARAHVIEHVFPFELNVILAPVKY